MCDCQQTRSGLKNICRKCKQIYLVDFNNCESQNKTSCLMTQIHSQIGTEQITVTTNLDHLCSLDIRMKVSNIRLSSIICTIGPSCISSDMLEQMMESGMNVARLNFSHGSHEEHAITISNIREAVKKRSKRLGRTVLLAIALDTKGPEIRTGLLCKRGPSEVELKKGNTTRLTTDSEFYDKISEQNIWIDYCNITKVLRPGNKVFIDDGLISLVVSSVGSDFVECRVENGGKLGSKKGVNLPGISVDLPAVSQKDESDLLFGVEQRVDMIFASFVRDAAAVYRIRSILGDRGKDIKIIAKIENHQGLANMDEIIDAADGIMVARGDLGIEIPTEQVFLAQKAMIARCNKKGKPVICATQMLESMTKNPRPTRAESSDVANAILDGADAVMLSGETAKGEYPLECVATMANICKMAEAAVNHKQLFADLVTHMKGPLEANHTIAIAAVEAADKCKAASIVVTTTTGLSAHLIAKYRPHCPIIAITRALQVANQCLIYRGITPLLYEEPMDPEWHRDVEARINFAINFGKVSNFIKLGDPVIVVSGRMEGAGFTNTIRILYVLE
ncbi:pyruvate kinase-like [Macrosteles quadrilineatus]|uniref:pyruvate kinase-like n=1 Tax=Macrosteles quadrilineatus TaxID=74068 RepID=UPI0023E19D77|nr:pyruvate kinase-like [Macrosteles quadrilineatus]XP_054289801.1 pyruvate kinase-like [Macrosteles quadrilineatus]